MGVIIASKKFFESWCEMFKRKSQEKNVVGKIFRQSLFVYILSDIASTAGPLVDGIVTGNFLGVEAVAAASFVLPVILIFTLIASIFASGSRSIYTDLLGQGKIDEANSIFTLANIFAVIFSLALSFLIITFSHKIMGFLYVGGGYKFQSRKLRRGLFIWLCSWVRVLVMRENFARLHEYR